MDTQVIELLGWNRLVTEVLTAGLEVALPLRDRGVDLIVYRDLVESGSFAAVPVQMKCSTGRAFGIDRKYERIAGLLLAYVWLDGPTFALSYPEALDIAQRLGWTAKPSWTVGNRYVSTRATAELITMLEPFVMTSEKWQQRVEEATQ